MEFSYNVSQTVNNKVDLEALDFEFKNSPVSNIYEGIKIHNNSLTVYTNVEVDLESTQDEQIRAVVISHQGLPKPRAKIFDFVSEEVRGKDFREIDYIVEPLPNLKPKRTFTRGELQKVEWFSDDQLTNKIIEVNITYTRDAFGFATDRITERKWLDQYNNFLPDTKITTKKYTLLEMIQEGKRRRGNIVDGVQLPVFSFLQEAASDQENPYGLNPETVLLYGRDFMDRFNSQFKNFVDNSSTVTDMNNPNFGKKNVVVAFEEASATTDPALNFQPTVLGGASILQYLINEFSI